MTLVAERSAAPSRLDSVGHAARVQHALSNTHDLAVGGVFASCDVREAHGVGGDIVDLIEADGQVLAVLGDVSGKGSAASLIAAMVQGSVQHHAAQIGPDPGALLIAVEASLRGVLSRTGAIVTVVAVAIDPDSLTVRIASAGHHPVLLRASGAPEWILPTCPPLGVVPPCGAERSRPFAVGSTLVLASDGITEQPDPAGEEFGLSRLDRALARAHRLDPRGTVDFVFAAVDEHARWTPASDDRAIVVATRAST